MNPAPSTPGSGAAAVILELPAQTFEHLKNILIWAALWDRSENGGKNRHVYDEVLAAIGIPR